MDKTTNLYLYDRNGNDIRIGDKVRLYDPQNMNEHVTGWIRYDKAFFAIAVISIDYKRYLLMDNLRTIVDHGDKFGYNEIELIGK